MIDPEDREHQAAVVRLMLPYLNGRFAAGFRLLGVLPGPGSVRIALHADDGTGYLYEIGDDDVAPGWVPLLLRNALARPAVPTGRLVMGMHFVPLRQDEVAWSLEEPAVDQVLRTLRALSDPGDEEMPFLVGFLLRGTTRLRLYVQRQERPGVVGVDVRLDNAGPAVLGSVMSLLEERRYRRPAGDDPHCAYVLDLTAWGEAGGS
ncbi:hypothetical protein FRZ03_22665 [Streptomyces misionensis]|uniref:Uncharacterized protein n=1 Tax=Streptomyces misionensis TaxID=67331 RepID=A0A5C6JFL8_9ACTN|nr:hypothetical protein [Streptomyces misionensis]TWV40326.1 hypothetical protein FRZ03_22665 [Streptomyces misionensis]